MSEIPRLATVGAIANLLGTSVHRIEYIVRTRNHIQPRALAGSARCFDDDAIAMIRHSLHAIDARRADTSGKVDHD